MGFSARSQLLSRIYPVSPSPVSSTQFCLQRETSWLNWTQFSSLSWLLLSMPWWEIQSFYEIAIFLNMEYFPVWQHSDLSNICTPNPSGDDSPARFILALVAISRRSCSSQSHKDFPDTQGKYKSMKRNPTNECIQPTEFTQLDHERRFQQIFFGLLTSTTIYSLAVMSLNNLVAEGQD